MVEKQTKQNIFWLWSDVIDFQKRGDVAYWLSEYFLPATARLTNKLSDVARLSDLKFNPNRNQNDRFFYIDISNINTSDGSYEKTEIKNAYAPLRARKKLERFDVIVSMVRPNRNATSIILENTNDLVCSTGFAVLKAIKINPYYLFIFTKTSYFIDQLVRQTSATMYPAVNENDVLGVRFSIPSEKEQQKVERIVQEVFQLKKEAEADYQKLQRLLNEAFGLTSNEIKQKLTFWRWNDEVDIVSRIDPDYYIKGYMQLAITKSIKLEPLSKFILSYSGGYTFETEKYLSDGIPIIRIKDLNYPEIKKPEDAFFADLPELQRFMAKPDDILISMSGTIGLSAIVPKELSRCYINQRITAITTKGINKFYLLAFLNSSFYRNELEKIGTGGVQTNVSYKQIISLSIPRLGNKEEIIGNLLKGFIEKNKESNKKLQEAKEFVENLIFKE